MIDPVSKYQAIRDEIRAEHNLIANRLTWFVTSQSFLVSAFAISRGNNFTWFHWFSTTLLPLLGFVSAALVLPSILGAIATIKLWHEKLHRFFEMHPDLKAALALKRPPWIENRGLLFPKMMPLLFATFWLVIGIASRFLP